MNVTLLMAISLDGFIARPDDTTPWSDAEWRAYAEEVKKRGNLVIGRRTYEIMLAADEFAILGQPLTVVLSETRTGSPDPRTRFVKTPDEALALLRSQGYTEAILGGGTAVNTSFLREGLIHELVLDVEPVTLGEGKRLFDPALPFPRLTLRGVEAIGTTTARVRYAVRRPT